MDEESFQAKCRQLEAEGFIRVERTNDIPRFAYNIPDSVNHPEVIYALLHKPTVPKTP